MSETRLSEREIFIFTPENQQRAEQYIAKYPKGRQASAVLSLLDLAQRQCGGWVPPAALETIAQILEMPSIRVFEVATFYTMFNLKPVGQYHLQVCGTTPCWLRGAEDIFKACEKTLGIRAGEVTPDGKFSLIEVECLGACVNTPVVQINDDHYEDLTPDIMRELLQDLANNKPRLPGSQINRQTSAPLGAVNPCGGKNATRS